MIISELLDLLDDSAKKYAKTAAESIRRNHHMNEISHDVVIDKRVTDAVIVGFVNYIAGRYGVDYAMYTRDLEEEKWRK